MKATNYTLRAHDAAEVIQRLAHALAWEGVTEISVDVAPMDRGDANLYVDGFLVATLRGKGE